MQHSHTPQQDDATYCVRHPDTQSNLRCGRCNDLICPRCMVTSPVGARCPSCARIGRPAILDTSSSEMGRAILFAAGAAAIGGIALSVVLKVLVELPFAFGVVDLIVIGGGMAGVGYLVGEAIRYGSGKKLDRRLKYVAAIGVFFGWAVAVALAPVFNSPAGIISGIPGIVGLIISFYVATYRVRV